jgi:hypothetical protein
MTTTTLTKSVQTVIAAATSNAATATTRGTVDLRTSIGGILTIKLNNAGTLGVQAVANILIAHNTGTTPTAASAGADWKTVYSVGNGIVSGTTGEWNYNIPASAMHLEVEVTGNTTNAVTCEAFVSRLDSASSV